MKVLSLPSIYSVTCHTKHVGQGSTFVAIDGYRSKGIDFVEDAIKRGAKRVILNEKHRDRVQSWLEEFDGIEFNFVADCWVALAELSSKSLGSPTSKLKIIGITGTKGKTSTAFLVEHMLMSAGYKTALLGSIKNKIGDQEVESDLTTPESDYLHVFFNACVTHGVEYVVMEVSSHAIALKRTYGIDFDVVAFTNLAPEHMDFHPTMEDYFDTKIKIFSQVKPSGHIVVNTDDEWGQKAFSIQERPVVSVGVKESFAKISPSCDYLFTVLQNDFAGLSIQIKNVVLEIPALFGMFNVYNVGIAYAICRRLGLHPASIKKSLKIFTGIPGRLQMHRMKNGSVAFVDFAHNPSSLQSVLSTLHSYKESGSHNHLIVVFGCGGERDKTKRPVMGRLASKYGDVIIVTNDNPRGEDPQVIAKEICSGVLKRDGVKSYCILDRGEAIRKAVGIARSDSIVAILGKGHESYVLQGEDKIYFDDFEEISKY